MWATSVVPPAALAAEILASPVATKPRMRRIQQGSELTNGRSGPSGQRHSIKYVQFQRTREELFSIDHTLKE